MRYFFTILFAYIALLANTNLAFAQSAETISKIENYLNNLKSLKAGFVQISSNGGSTEGSIYIQKPNRIRMEYADPVSVLIVGNGDYIVYNDKELDQVSHIDYDDIPATLILTNEIKIDNKNIKIDDFYEDKGTTIISLDYKNKGDLGPITLIFNNSPFELKQWKIVDPQGIEVAVSLYDVELNSELDSGLFKFKKKKAPMSYKKK